MTDVVARAKTLLQGITPGPWEWEGDSFSDQQSKCPHGTEWIDHGPNLVRAVNQTGYDAANYVITSSGYDASSLFIRSADAEFIAAAPTLIAELITEIEHLRGAAQCERNTQKPARPASDDDWALRNVRG